MLGKISSHQLDGGWFSDGEASWGAGRFLQLNAVGGRNTYEGDASV